MNDDHTVMKTTVGIAELKSRSRRVVREPAAAAPRIQDLRLPSELRTKADILGLLAQERGEQ